MRLPSQMERYTTDLSKELFRELKSKLSSPNKDAGEVAQLAQRLLDKVGDKAYVKVAEITDLEEKNKIHTEFPDSIRLSTGTYLQRHEVSTLLGYRESFSIVTMSLFYQVTQDIYWQNSTFNLIYDASFSPDGDRLDLRFKRAERDEIVAFAQDAPIPVSVRDARLILEYSKILAGKKMAQEAVHSETSPAVQEAQTSPHPESPTPPLSTPEVVETEKIKGRRGVRPKDFDVRPVISEFLKNYPDRDESIAGRVYEKLSKIGKTKTVSVAAAALCKELGEDRTKFAEKIGMRKDTIYYGFKIWDVFGGPRLSNRETKKDSASEIRIDRSITIPLPKTVKVSEEIINKINRIMKMSSEELRIEFPNEKRTLSLKSYLHRYGPVVDILPQYHLLTDEQIRDATSLKRLSVLTYGRVYGNCGILPAGAEPIFRIKRKDVSVEVAELQQKLASDEIFKRRISEYLSLNPTLLRERIEKEFSDIEIKKMREVQYLKIVLNNIEKIPTFKHGTKLNYLNVLKRFKFISRGDDTRYIKKTGGKEKREKIKTEIPREDLIKTLSYKLGKLGMEKIDGIPWQEFVDKLLELREKGSVEKYNKMLEAFVFAE